MKIKMIQLTVLDSASYRQMLKKKPLLVYYAIVESPFGECLIGFIEGKICHLSFVNRGEKENFLKLKKEWPGASVKRDIAAAVSLAKGIFKSSPEIEIIVRGTKFQERVWKELLKINKGETLHYGDVAAKIGYPKAVRAVANAVARNRVAYLIPCHRVISKNGDVYKYSGGASVKKKLLDAEGFHGE